ncbi:hypothetical protein CMO88_04750 [Candidatus Woesearchaeota archaeon]|nr:hypothetical protein [Candidatus Woesearchaeota archaeon]|tara:strand:+ start:15997 stop:18189 length:2193 start_codon:yes stop_codon:yes gene_type:complete
MKFTEKGVLAAKYKLRLARELGVNDKTFDAAKAVKSVKKYSSNYDQFKKENLPKPLSIYEKTCNFCSHFLKINPGKKRSAELKKLIGLAHLNTTPFATVSFAVIVLFLILLLGAATWFLTGSLFVLGYAVIIGLIMLVALLKLPDFFANSWRLQASNQMVQCVFYMAAFMRHTSNIELAVKFAADRLKAPLSLDLKKVLWDVETGKYKTIKESLDSYLETWKDWNMEFIESLHLLEGSLYESSEGKRLNMIDKSLDLMLEETYNKMLRYTHDLKAPITMLYMLGLVLPILGLVILPMVASFMTSDVAPLTLAIYIALLYNFTIPVLLFYLTKTTLSKRPTGYGEVDIAEEIPALKKYRNIIIRFFNKELLINPLILSLLVGAILLLIGTTPWLLQFIMSEEVLLNERPFETSFGFKFLDYRLSSNGLIGPYGMGAAVLSMFVPLALGIGFGMYFLLRSQNIFKIRARSKKLENEFASALFQLGNRIGDGVPVEVAVGKVAKMMQGTVSGEFFSLVNMNMRKFGMNFERAVFDSKAGAINYFPSPVIESAMKVLLESSKKGPKSASSALINISEYIKDIHRVNERLRDLMADIISDMKQQVGILAPAIAGIVVGITSMIIGILGQLTEQIANISTLSEDASVPSGLLSLFGDGIPTYYFQIIIGVYIVQVIYIMTLLINGIESGSDKLSERYLVGTNLIRSTFVYVVIALTITIVFNAIASSIIGGITGVI